MLKRMVACPNPCMLIEVKSLRLPLAKIRIINGSLTMMELPKPRLLLEMEKKDSIQIDTDPAISTQQQR